ncbi:MFS transporter [Streptomyces beijiangensis]|uniref:MFS transporter n=1 Tax=Streptomyces beijiangensis TaxID=163361 RepID=A0A939F8Y1_9ACTN|nr:MFS transporter [Streptomyces beijiangensis]MBO0514570.1 MFS transporter [Streptomyces beijiangensis]
MEAAAKKDTATGAIRARPAYRDRNVLRWLVAYSASLLGDGIYFVALAWAANAVATPAQVGIVMAMGSIPRAVLMLGGGVVADRFGPRAVVLGSDALRCLVILAVAAALVFSSPGLWVLIAVALVFGVVDALFLPAVGALPPRITEPSEVVRLQSMVMLAGRLSRTTAPPLAGLAMGLGGSAAAFALAGGLFCLSLVLLWAVRIGSLPVDATIKDTEPTTPWRDLVEGLSYIRRHKVIGPLVLSGAMSQFGIIAPLTVGLVLLCDERGWGAAGMGWISGAFGVGTTSMALLLTVRGRLPRAGMLQNISLVVASGGIAAIGLIPSLPGAAMIALLSGLASGVCGGLATSLIQTATNPAYLGRVSSVMAFTGVGIAPLAYPLFGVLTGVIGTGPLYIAGGVLSALGATVGLASRAVRGAELPEMRA